MEDLFRDYWWLMFPLVGFAFAGWDRYLAYRRQRDNIEVLKAYAANGREPPPEVVRAASSSDDDRDEWGFRYRRCRTRGPMGEWRRTIFMATLAGAFYFAGQFMADGNLREPFSIVAVIMGALALASLLVNLLAALWKPK